MKLISAILLALLAVPQAFADQTTETPKMVGQVEFQAIVNLFSSPFGLAIGLLVTTWGLWTMVVSQKFGRGLILIILGVIVSIFPSFYYAFRSDLYDIPAGLGGSGKATDFKTYLKNAP